MAVPWGPIIGGAVSLIGGLIGGKKQETTQNRVNYKQLVRDAEAAGFNPLTALRAGGAAGYTQTSHPALSSFSPLGSALQTVGGMLANYDPQANARAALEDQLMTARLENIQTDTKARLHSMEVPVKTGASAVSAFGSPIRSAAAQLHLPTPITQGDRESTNPFPTDWGLFLDPKVPNGDTWETAFGEPGGYVGAPVVGWRTFKYNADLQLEKAKETFDERRKNNEPDNVFDRFYKFHKGW